jgi:predicted O-methyltransferase YrrM
MTSHFEFTNSWFAMAKPAWELLIPNLNPKRILEIGSHEGASTCFLIEKLGSEKDIEIHCVDTWEGGVEHQPGGAYATDMSDVERRFTQNVRLARAEATEKVDVIVHKGASHMELAKLLAAGKGGYFDFIYIDGSHMAVDVLCDAVLSFKLLRIKGTLVFDDYLWKEQGRHAGNPLHCPKPAVDAFTNVYFQKVRLLNAPLRQVYVEKLED